MPKSDPHFVPEPDRAVGEPGVGGLSRNEAEQRAAELTAPEIWEAFCKQFPEYWYRKAGEIYRREGAPVSILVDFLPDPAKADRTPLQLHLNQELRAGLWICFGFSERDEKRVRIASPWRVGLTFGDSGGLTTAAGAHYSDVLHYRVETPVGTQETAAPGTRGQKRKSGRKKIDVSAEVAEANILIAQGKNEHQAAWKVAELRYPGHGKANDDLRQKLVGLIRTRLRDARRR